MPDLFEDFMRTNDLGDRVVPDPSRRDKILAKAYEDNVAEVEPRRRAHWGRRIAIAAAVAAVTGGLALTMFTAAPTLMASASDKVLTKAAQNATDPPAKAGQYWKITTTGVSGVTADTRPVYSICLVKQSGTAYISVDGNKPNWYTNSKLTVVKQIQGTDCTLGEGEGSFTRNRTDNDDPGGWDNPKADWVAALPTTVDGLRDKIYKDSKGSGTGADNEAFEVIAEALKTGRAPAQLRSKLFEVLKTIPGTTVTDESVDINGRTGVAIGRMETNSSTDPADEPSEEQKVEIVIDSNTGELIGERYPSTTPDGEASSTYTEFSPREVVDDIPADVKKNAIHEWCDDTGTCYDEKPK